MSFIKTITKGIGKLAVAAFLLGAFLVGLVSVVYLSLRGEPVTVPEIIGKNKSEAEKELIALGLKMKKRADRYSSEKPDTILEQLPKPGETVKTGQIITVVVARANAEGEEEPAVVATPNSNTNEDDNESSVPPELRRPDKIKPKNKNTNENSNKKANQNNNSNTNKNTNKNTSLNNSKPNNSSKENTNKSDTGTANKSGNTTTSTPKPTPAATPKPTTSGEVRDRKVP